MTSSAARRHPDHNEDACLLDAERGLAAVFDGIGGVAGGDLCSQAAREHISSCLANLPAADDLRGRRDWLRDSVLGAAAAVRAVRTLAGQGTTACIALRCEDVVLIAGAGDSRAYRFGAAGLELLTVDDDGFGCDEVAAAARRECDLVSDPDELSGLAARMFHRRNTISSELGMISDGIGIDGAQVTASDLIVLTSDGVHDNLAGPELELIIAANREGGPERIAAAIQTAARARADDQLHPRSKDDDITAVVLAID